MVWKPIAPSPEDDEYYGIGKIKHEEMTDLKDKDHDDDLSDEDEEDENDE